MKKNLRRILSLALALLLAAGPVTAAASELSTNGYYTVHIDTPSSFILAFIVIIDL